ncbi:MAG: sulfotransferase domain-containing protein [Salibacteraceae bacterium]
MLIKLLKNIKHTGIRIFRESTAPFRKTPDFVIIGVQKGGTTSLFHYLGQHPDIRLSSKKEVHFFDSSFNKGGLWYKSHFPFLWNKRITGEASPEYFYFPEVPKRMKKICPDAKIILLLRNPAERAISHFYHNNKKHKGNREPIAKYKEAFALSSDRIKNREFDIRDGHKVISYENWHYSYLEKGDYSTQLERWLNYFDKDQILVRASEDFFQDPKPLLKECYSFLGVKEIYPNDLKPKNVNATRKSSLYDLDDELINLVKDQIIELKKLGYNFSNWR